ncbi:unnamed protein product [Protopolystoma xenopodis]|uniref:Uncharacterized protein n=1 Tax=Protopolystoma xenopodis TaxID=117903 RepID=A0A3S5A7B3_9PLAT|nr:unnamed protein product [Protopolystoma xenopodis]
MQKKVRKRLQLAVIAGRPSFCGCTAVSASFAIKLWDVTARRQAVCTIDIVAFLRSECEATFRHLASVSEWQESVFRRETHHNVATSELQLPTEA